MTTVIKSSYGFNNNRQLEVSEDGGINFVIRDNGTAVIGITVRPYDLRKALGIDELGCGCDEADENLKAAIKRAEDAEAFGAAAATRAEEAESDAREWKARAEKAEADHEDTKAAYRALGASHAELLTRAEKAEAAVARVQHIRDVSGDTVGVEELDAILNPKPAFTLPTEAGTIVLAKGSGNRQDYELHRTTKGRWFTPGLRQQWTDAEMLAEFTDHRLIGADQ